MKQKYAVVIIEEGYNRKNISSSMMQVGGLIVILDCLYRLNPLLGQEYCEIIPPLPINTINSSRNNWQDNQKRLESKLLTEKKEKSFMKIIKTQGRIYFTRK